MDKVEALEKIKGYWNDGKMPLGKKIVEISNEFYSVGLDLPTTAAFIKATPAELDALLSLGALDDAIIDEISKIDPPKTAWALLANASDEEIHQALSALREKDAPEEEGKKRASTTSFVYQQMLEASGPTIEQRVSSLSGFDLYHAFKKGQDFNAMSDWETKFLRSVSAQKRKGKPLSNKQIPYVIQILETLADKGAIVRDSIDGDKEICDRILDAIGR